jgi:aquaporin Z
MGPTTTVPIKRLESVSQQQIERPASQNVLTPYFCEFLGTFLLAFTICSCPYGFWTPAAIAGVVMALVFSFGPVSGCQMNPAVSFAILLAGKMKLKTFLGYIIAQLAGALLSVLLFTVCFGMESVTVRVTPMPPYSFGVSASVEMIYTAMLCFVYLHVTGSSTMDNNHFYGIAIAFAVLAGGYSARDVSCALFNPALALAFSLNQRIGYGLLFALAELGAAIIAACWFRICRANEYAENHMLYEIETGDRQTLYDIALLDPPSLHVRMWSEFLGTCWLIVTYGLNIVLNTGATAVSAGACLATMTYSLATVSGGHFNPAVTLGVVLSGRNKCSARDGCYYALVQLLAAILVGIFLGYLHSHGPTPKSIDGLSAFNGVNTWYQIAIVEALFTFILAYVVLTVATSEAHTASWPSFYFALAIGFTVAGATYAAGNISGGYLNPAVALGFAVEGEPTFTSDATVKQWPGYLDTLMRTLSCVFKFIGYYLRCFWYWIPELLGACAAAAMFRKISFADYERRKTLY